MNINNISEEDAWNILVEEGIDKILNITKDEFDLIKILNSSETSMSNAEIASILSAYKA